MKKTIAILSIFLVLLSCEESSTSSNNLMVGDNISPMNNSICEGLVTNTNSQITVVFDWEEYGESNDINYEVLLINLDTQEEIIESSNTNVLSINLEPGIRYSWQVTGYLNSEIVSGEVWQFQTPYEAETNYAPFPATLEFPQNGVTLVNTSVLFQWQGADPDNGETATLQYELYLGTTNSPNLHTANLSGGQTSVTLNSGEQYYWYIKSIDAYGNTSYSQTRSFSIQ